MSPAPRARTRPRPPSLVLTPGPSSQNVLKVVRDRLYVPKVAESTLAALPHLKLAAGSLSEVSHWTQVHIDGPEHVPAVIEVFGSFDCVLFFAELDVDVSTEVVALIVAHAHLFDFAVFLFALEKDVLEEIFELFLDFVVAHITKVGAVS